MLTYILTSAKLDAASYRWLAALSTYSFNLQYRAGKQNLDVRGLSRRPHETSQSQKEQERIDRFIQQHLIDGYTEVIPPEVVDTICHSRLVRADAVNQGSFTLVESLAHSVDAVPASYVIEDQHGLPVIEQLSHSDLKEKQRMVRTLTPTAC